jgi:Cu/Ag efflux protein CusF
MKAAAIAAVVFSLAAVPVCNAQVKDSAVAVKETEAVVTVTKVDKEKRTVTFRGPKGNLGTLTVPKEGQNFDQVKAGQQYRMRYVEAVALEIRKGGKPAASTSEQVKVSPKGAKPGGIMAQTLQVSGVVDAIDFTDRYIAVRGPKQTLSLKVADDVPLDQLAIGDLISVTHTAALAIEMVAQAPAKKAPAPKEPAAKKAP